MEDLGDFAKSWTNITTRYLKALPIRVDYCEKLQSGQGWKVEISSLGGGAQFSFNNFRLRKNVYEDAARRGGLDGKLEWKESNIPEQIATPTEEFSKMCFEIRHMGVLIVEKLDCMWAKSTGFKSFQSTLVPSLVGAPSIPGHEGGARFDAEREVSAESSMTGN